MARRVAVLSQEQFAVRMPGFGVVTGTTDAARSYVCDALLGLSAEDVDTTLLPRADGSWLLGGRTRPLRIVAPDGCAWRLATGWPSDVGVAAASATAGEPDVYFAVSEQPSPMLYRSDDGGESWQAQASLNDGGTVTGMAAVRGTTDAHVYLTRANGTATSLLRSTNGGETFSTVEHRAELTLLDARAAAPDRLWFSSPRPASNDIAILSATADETLATERHRVRFFGGLALDRQSDTVWIADEAGGLARSDDGATFESVYDALAIACLAHSEGRLWACTAGTNQERALAYSDDRGMSFTDAFAFAEVDQLVTCSPSVGVADTCAAAWNEWRADVLPLPMSTDAGSDAPTAPDASTATKSRATCGCNTLGSNVPPNTSAWMFGLALALSWRARTWRISRKQWSRRAPH